MITNYHDFKKKLYEVGFSMGGMNDEGIFAISSYYSDRIQWHTDDIDSDPWEWRMRVIEDKEDIAYGKLFFRKSGYITKKWYPYFLSIRNTKPLLDEYSNGNISIMAKNIYETIKVNKTLPLHVIKAECNITKATKAKFDRAMDELQMKMYITVCGRARKQSKDGKSYGWSSTTFCITEEYFDHSVFEKARKLNYDASMNQITNHILTLNPNANSKKMKKFITG